MAVLGQVENLPPLFEHPPPLQILPPRSAHEKTLAHAFARARARVGRVESGVAQPVIRARAFFFRRFIQSSPARAARPTLARAIVAGSGTAATRKPTWAVAVVELRKIPAAVEFQRVVWARVVAQLPEKGLEFTRFYHTVAILVKSIEGLVQSFNFCGGQN